MPIVSSAIREDRPQRDGRRSVREEHTDHVGEVHTRSYLAPAALNVAAGLPVAAAAIAAGLQASELEANARAVEADDSPVLRFTHSTPAQLADELRARFRAARGPSAGRIASRLLTLTDAQLRTLFNATAGELPALKTRLQDKAAKLAAINNEAGE